MAGKLGFSGHESFTCKQFWLKKVYDFVAQKRQFNDEVTVVTLGVGKNMVASLRYWGKAFYILDDDDQITPLANLVFDDDGYDPYLEDFGTIWLLHYNLVKTGKASIYNLVFNEFRKERNDFTKDQLHGFLKRKCLEISPYVYNTNTINTDINVFFRNYVKPHRDDKVEVEDDFSGVMMDLDLIKVYKQQSDQGTVTRYKIDPQERIDLPNEILLYTILDNYGDQRTIGFRELLTGMNSPGAVFALTADGLYSKLTSLTQQYRDLIFTETAGNQVLQIKGNLLKQSVLNGYYEK
ncbi:MAG: DUF4007 family protein [Flavisolibacter sp.]